MPRKAVCIGRLILFDRPSLSHHLAVTNADVSMTTTTTQDARLSKIDLFPAFKKNIGAQYPEKDGWKVFNRFNWVSYLHDFVLQRSTENGAERILIEINTDKEIRNEQIDQMRQVADRLAHDGTKVSRLVLVVSEDAATCSIPEDVSLCTLSEVMERGLPKLSA